LISFFNNENIISNFFFLNSKIAINLFIELLHFSISSFSNSLSNSFNSSSKFISLSRNFNKLDEDLHSIQGSLSQYLLTKINFSTFCICKRHLVKLVRIPTKEKIVSIYICDPTIPKICWAKNSTIENITLCFYHHWKKHLMSLTSNWYFLKNQRFPLAQNQNFNIYLQNFKA